jgi:glutamyl-tRNA reductase
MNSTDDVRAFVVGADHRSSTALLRDRLFVDETLMPQVFGRLRAAGLEQALILSTCDRTEVHGVHDAPEAMVTRVRDDLAAMGNVDSGEIADQTYALYDDAALRHIFAVAASLESQIVGEPQVLGQVKAAHRQASACGMTGPVLDSVMEAAYSAAKRVRTETEVGRRPVSIASAAALIAQELHGDLARCAALIIGLGEIGELIHEYLRTAGLQRCTMTGPAQRTEIQARRAGLTFAPFSAIEEAVAGADIVISAVGTGRRILGQDTVAQALRRRRRRPILLLDGGVPGDIDPSVEDCDGAYLYTLDDLEQVAMKGRAERREAAEDAWAIIDEAVVAWRRGRVERGAAPAVVAMRQQFEAARTRVLREHPSADAARATALLVNQLLHQPTQVLRSLMSGDDSMPESDPERLKRLIQQLFCDQADKDGN